MPRDLPANTHAGLDPWQVKKVYAALAQGNAGHGIRYCPVARGLAARWPTWPGRPRPDRGPLPRRSATRWVLRRWPPALPGRGQGDFFAGLVPARRPGPPAVGHRAVGGRSSFRAWPSGDIGRSSSIRQAATAGRLAAAGRNGRLDRGLDAAGAGGDPLSSGRPLRDQRARRHWRPRHFNCSSTTTPVIRFAGRR